MSGYTYSPCGKYFGYWTSMKTGMCAASLNSPGSVFQPDAEGGPRLLYYTIQNMRMHPCVADIRDRELATPESRAIADVAIAKADAEAEAAGAYRP